MPRDGQNEAGVRGVPLALVAYLVVFAAKLAAYFILGVVALSAESLHTLTDIFISAARSLITLTRSPP